LVTLFYTVEEPAHKVLQPLLFLLGPMLFFYVIENCNVKPIRRQRFIFHAMPAVALLLLFVMQFIVDQSGFTIFKYISHRDVLSGYKYHELVYVLCALYWLRKSKQEESTDVGAHIKFRIIWLQRFCLLDVLILGTEISFHLMSQLIDISWLPQRTILVSILVLMLVIISFFVIKQPLIIYQEQQQSKPPAQNKYERSGLVEDSSKFYSNKIIHIMSDQQLFLDSDLTLAKLAKQVGLTTHNLSQVLNQTFQQSFYDYINKLRIEHAKSMLHGDESIIDVAMKSGFNSKASFYNAFNKELGMPPGEWRKHFNQVNLPPRKMTILKVNN